MNLLPTSEQQQIIDSTASFLADKMPLRRLHGRDPSAETLWSEMAAMGWLGLGVAEGSGGVGYGPSEEVLLFRELGRELGPPRLLFTSVAAHAAVAASQRALAGRLMSGELKAALAVQDDFSAPFPDTLDRRRIYEVHGADVALVIDGARSRIVDLRGVEITPCDCLDPSVSMGLADLSAASVLSDAVEPRVGLAAVLSGAAMMVGLAEKARDMIVEYAKIRCTFGRPIGAYQAVRHPCAEMAVRCEEAKAQLFLASVALADGLRDAPLQVAAARVMAEDAALLNADNSIQLHGGIGVTDEFDAHFLLKRINVMAGWFGYSRSHLRVLLDNQLHS